MARLRTLKPGFFGNEELAACSFAARLAFEGLWVEADREGRLKDQPQLLRSRIFPFDAVDMEALLCELAVHGFIKRYRIGRARLIQVCTFAKHQHPHPKESPSELPPPRTPGKSGTSRRACPRPSDTADPLAFNRPSRGTGTTRPVERMRLDPVGSGIWDLGSGSEPKSTAPRDEAPEETEAGTFRLLCALVRQERARCPELDSVDLLEHCKTQAARARISYSSWQVGRAIEAVTVADGRRAARRARGR